MNPQDLENKAIEIYRELMAREIESPTLAADKKSFLARYQPQPAAFPGFDLLAPAALLVCLFIFFFRISPAGAPVALRPAAAKIAAGQEASSMARRPVAKPAPQPLPTRLQPPARVLFPRVMVKSATSDVGQPMVFRKSIDSKPITVIWVFMKPAGVPA